MKFNSKVYNDHVESDEEDENEEDEDEANDDDNDVDSQEDGDDDDEDEDGDELEDDEDEPPEMDAPNIDTGALLKPKQSLGGGKAKIVSKQQQDGQANGKANRKPIAILAVEAIRYLNERSGSSIIAIKRVIMTNHPDMDERRVGFHIKRFVKSCLDNGTMVQIKRSFKITKKLEEEQKKLAKEREKARKEKHKDKAKKMKKTKVAKENGKEKGKQKTSKDKEKSKTVKPPSSNNDKGKPAKKPKIDVATSKASKGGGSKGQTTKGASAKPKIKVKSRKSINLVVKHTPPQPKKKSKTAAGKQKPDSKTNNAVAETSKAVTPASGRGKKTKT